MATEQTLVMKLAEAVDQVGGIEKKGRNQAQSYDYVKAADVAKALRHELFSRGIVVIPDEVECIATEIEFMNAKGETRHSNQVQLKTAYHITDGTTELVMHGIGIAWDSGDKAIYKAKTGALKYFLRGLGLVPDEKDDPEADESIDKALGKVDKGFKQQFDQSTKDQARNITPAEAKVFWQAVKKGGKTTTQVQNYFKSLKISATEQMLYSDYDMCLKWAVGMEKDYLDTLKKSVSTVETPESDKHNFDKIFALAAKHNIPRDDVRKVGHEIYKVQSLNDLTPEQFEGLLEWVEQQVSA